MNISRISCLISSATKTNLNKHVSIGKIRRTFAIYSPVKTEQIEEAKPMILQNYRIVSGIVLTRSPQILRDLHPFEREYYLYQQKLEQIHSPPFPEDFYFKKGSIAEKKWKEKKEQDKKNALAIFTRFNTNEADKDNEEEENHENFGSIEEEEIKIASRITQADLNNDMKSLNRALQRTLYLIVKKPRYEHAWQFPQGGVNQKETLVQVRR
jgi:large subunit ribosomal protein L46